jgi:hypothetical protein
LSTGELEEVCPKSGRRIASNQSVILFDCQY